MAQATQFISLKSIIDEQTVYIETLEKTIKELKVASTEVDQLKATINSQADRIKALDKTVVEMKNVADFKEKMDQNTLQSINRLLDRYRGVERSLTQTVKQSNETIALQDREIARLKEELEKKEGLIRWYTTNNSFDANLFDRPLFDISINL